MTLDGKLLRDERKAVEIAPLSAFEAAGYRDADLLGGADPASTVAVFELHAEGEAPSRGVVYFKPAKEITWHQAGLRAELRRDGDGYVVEIEAARLARAVWIDFGALDAELPDNALTVLPGERVQLRLNSTADEDALRAAMNIRSLSDAVRAITTTP
jgi:beta-mannosidase